MPILLCAARVMLRGFMLMVAVALTARAAADQRPNILFCFADDWGYFASAYRQVEGADSIHSLISTPNFDRVAREGALFTRAHVTAPSCTPCRSSLLSGQYFWRTGLGAILNGAQWDRSIPTYPLLLEAAGYHIGFTYKVWSPGTPADAPYGAPLHRYEKAGREINRFSQNVTKASNREAKKREIYQQVYDNFSQFLAERKPGQPWCYWFGPTETHRPYQRGSGRELWGIDPERFKGHLPPFMPDNEVTREDFADYFGEAQSVDAALGMLLRKLEETGELDRTLIVVSGDHGMPGVPRGKCNLYEFGTHVALAARWPGHVPAGRVVSDFVNLMDLAPTFLEVAGEKPPAVMTGRSFLNVLTSARSGQVDPTRTWVVTGRERHVDSARPGNLPYPHRAIRTKDFVYIRNFAPERWPMGAPGKAGVSESALGTNTRLAFADMDASPTKTWLILHGDEPAVRPYFDLAFGLRPAEELYDLRRDPAEMHNVAADAAYAADRERLSAQLMAELRRTNDPRVIGDGATFDRLPYTVGPGPARGRKQGGTE